MKARGWSHFSSRNGWPNSVSRNSTPRRLRAEGGVEFGAAHYPLMIVAAWFVAARLVGVWSRSAHQRVLAGGFRVPADRPRCGSSRALGRRWTTRVIVLRGAAPVARGPYRWIKHPNYLIVALEIAVVPLALGLPMFALIFSIANAALLVYRIRVENEALAWAAQAA